MLTFTPEANLHIGNHVGTHVCLTTVENVCYYYNSKEKSMECSFTITKCDPTEWNSFMACLKLAEPKDNGSLWTITIEDFQKDEENITYGMGTCFEATYFTKAREENGSIHFCFTGRA